MTQDERRDLRMKLKRTKWACKKQTGKNPTKKEMLGAYDHIARTVVKEPPKPKENWKSNYNEPVSIGELIKNTTKRMK